MTHIFFTEAIQQQKLKETSFTQALKDKISKIFILALISFLFLPNQSISAQDYTQALGLRFGSTKGLTYKNFVGDSQALEGMIVYHQDGFRGIGLFEQHFFLGRNSNSAIYLGIGGYAGVTALLDDYPGKLNVAGVSAILGFEYTFPHSNLIFALDLNPAYELIQSSGLSGNQAAVSLRYMLD